MAFLSYDLGIDLPYLKDIVWVVFIVYGTLHFMYSPGDLQHIELEIFTAFLLKSPPLWTVMIGTVNVTDVMNYEVGKMQHLQKYTANFAYISLPYIEGGIHVEYHYCDS